MSLRQLKILGCSSQQPTRRRNHGAYLLRWDTEGFLFDPGEGTQRQFIFADVAPTCVTRIFISHFHGDHCLGLGSMLMRLNLDAVKHPIHCYYPASGKVYFDRLRYGTVYHENITVVEHPVSTEGEVHDFGDFVVEAFFLEHGTPNLGWRIRQKDWLKFLPDKLQSAGVRGAMVADLQKNGQIYVAGRTVRLTDVSVKKPGDIFSVIIDTAYTSNALKIADSATLLLCESTYCEQHAHLARKHQHLTAKQAALIAKKAGTKKLVLTHFSARYQDLTLLLEEARSIFPNTDIAEDFKSFNLRT